MTTLLFILLLRLTTYLASAAQNTGAAVIVCPGGSYYWHDMQAEGVDVAHWLNSQGINAYVLRYRTPSAAALFTGYRLLGFGPKYPSPLRDVEEALAFVYDHAAEHGVDTAAVGVIGFSAGGHLAMSSYLYNHTPYRPKFLAPIYPVVSLADDCAHRRSRRGLLGPYKYRSQSMRDSLSLERHISADCPPVFLVACADDPVVDPRNSILLDSALTAEAVPHRFLYYTTGGHGFGVSDTKGTPECQQWKKEFLLWISNFVRQPK